MSKPADIIKEMGFLKNERGQMAIFIALFFQVLFVFFAMAINVGLVVHDKINLQNSVDIAAYYGAMKQGEVLNQIAHINYQMRQNYKLFVWRYRVLGTLGNRNHPLSYIRYLPGAPGSYPLPNEAPSFDPADSNLSWQVQPSVCVSHSFWQETRDLDDQAASVCRDNDVALPATGNISGAVNFIFGANQLGPMVQTLNIQLARFCKEAGIMNFQYAARMLAHFRSDGVVRKNMIATLADNLTRSEPLDLRNQPIREGVEKTFRRNLTDTNSNGVQNIQYFNSLGSGGCAQMSDWLSEIKINPVIFYSDWDSDQSNGQCTAAQIKQNRGGGPAQEPFGFQDAIFQNQRNDSQVLLSHWAGEPSTPGWHSSVGFEKNPWCMVYSGVRATTAIRKPFDPTGGGVTLEARGFAKPFGGRIGPWYGKTWSRGSPNSTVSSRDQMVDPLLPSRDAPGSSASTGQYDDVANYSRYPGDTLGITSLRAMGAMVQNFMRVMAHNDRLDPSAIALANYSDLNGVPRLQVTGDSLARVGSTGSAAGLNKVPKQRVFELAATAPDVFDALYYSIEPRYYDNYFRNNTTSGGAQLNEAERIFDFGSAKDAYNDPTLGQATQEFSTLELVQLAANPNQAYMADYEPIIRDWTHLLTSWHQRGVVDFTMDPGKFGACQMPVDDRTLPTTGTCIEGRRAGFSVKYISLDFLLSSVHALGGGASGASGAILNPPPQAFQQ